MTLGRNVGREGWTVPNGHARWPAAIAIDGDFVYVTDWGVRRVQKFGFGGTTPVQETTWGRLKVLYR